MKNLLLLFCFLASGCSSYKYFNYPEKEQTIPSQYKIHVRNVNVDLYEKKTLTMVKSSTPQYLDENELEKRFREEISDQLKRDNLYSDEANDSDVFESEFDLNYIRSFMIFTDDKYAGSWINGYKIKVYKGDKLIAVREDNSQYYVDKGFVGNLAKIFKTVFLIYDEKDEKEEVEIFATSIAKDLKKLGE